MSLRAELLRLLLRAAFKSRSDAPPDLEKLRRGMRRTAWLVPRPPRDTTARHVLADGVPAVALARPRSRPDRHILYLHGGAYVFGSPVLYRDFIWRIADAAEARVLVLDYRLAPEHPFPAAVDDAVGAYRWLVAGGADPARIAVMGDSAGGGLAFAMLLRLRDEGGPLPAAAVALSPWTDLTLGSESARRNARRDPMLSGAQARHFAAWYAGGDLQNPYASPLSGNPHGLPPSLIHVGGDEILLDDSVRMAERLRQAGCTVELDVWPRMPHVWHLHARILPEGKQAIARIGTFLRSRMGETR